MKDGIKQLFGLILVIGIIIGKIIVGVTIFAVFLGYEELFERIKNPPPYLQQPNMLQLIISLGFILICLYFFGRWTLILLRKIFSSKTMGEIADEDRDF